MSGIFIVLILLGLLVPVYLTNIINDLTSGVCIGAQHSCSGTACIPLKNVCNGVEECADGSDEANCAIEMECEQDHFLCKKATGISVCLSREAYPYISVLCPGCGEPPSIDHGVIIIDKTYKRSAIGAFGEVKCNKGYKSCTRIIWCLPSGTWTTATCQPEHDSKYQKDIDVYDA